ncbi:MAG: hypothetical protein ACHQPI_02685 [Thermoanaerobaculia bacterium]
MEEAHKALACLLDLLRQQLDTRGMTKNPKTKKPTKKPQTGRPAKFVTGARNLSVYLPEEAITALRQFAAAQVAATGKARHASDVILEALRSHEPFREFVKKLDSEAGRKSGGRGAPTWDDVLGGGISELELKRK